MENSRLNDMLARYGEVCTQKTAAQILNIVPRTVSRMCDEGRLRRVEHRVDVRSIYEYIVNPRKANFESFMSNDYEKKHGYLFSVCDDASHY